MEQRDVNKMLAFSQEKMKKIGIFDASHLFCDVYCFEPGQVQKPHTHEGSDKVYFVLEGRGTFRVGQEEKEVGERNLVLAPSGVEHGVSNNSRERLILLVIMAPNPNTAHSH